MAHYRRLARPWEVCVHVLSPPNHIELGCSPPESADAVGGHLVVLVEDAFLVDASLGQVSDAHPDIQLPPVFVGRLAPGPLREVEEFQPPGARLRYQARSMSTDYRISPDWGPSPEREAARTSIIAHIDEYARRQGIT
jgi:hypothetical protein